MNTLRPKSLQIGCQNLPTADLVSGYHSVSAYVCVYMPLMLFME